LPIKVARIFNTYGPRTHPNDGRVVSTFIVQALLNRDITVFGDGSQTRSFCYVDDLVSGLIKLMESPRGVTGPINLGNSYARAYGLEFITLRYFNACGADPDAEIGELRDPETHLIPRAMMAIQGHITDFTVFGNDYPPEGTAIRDYVQSPISPMRTSQACGVCSITEAAGSSISGPAADFPSRRWSPRLRRKPANNSP
jgi:nucleoside-diphosphate-sugar epimerase